jgi:DNA-binding transcriptional MerR regulator
MNDQTKKPENPRDAKLYTSGDLMEATGISYRVVNDWETRAGIFSSEREGGAGWRKFSENDLYALRICADVKNRIPLSLEAIGGIYRWLISPGRIPSPKEIEHGVGLMMRELEASPDGSELVKDAHARRAAERQLRAMLQRPKPPVEAALEAAEGGMPIYFFTDLEQHVILPEATLEQLVQTRLANKPAILFQLNNSFNAVRAKLNLKALPFRGYSVDELVKVIAQSKLTSKELQILKLIRERAYQRITLEVKGGDVFQVFVDDELPVSALEDAEKKVVDAIRSGAYQQLTLRVQEGGIFRLARKTSLKFGKEQVIPKP